MDPFLMPRSFCLAQIAVINLSAFLLTGICTCLSITITILVLWPSQNASAYSYVPLLVCLDTSANTSEVLSNGETCILFL